MAVPVEVSQRVQERIVGSDLARAQAARLFVDIEFPVSAY
jgi:hypothetical protein